MNDTFIGPTSLARDRLPAVCRISALMLTDAGNSPTSLGEALESIFAQTVRPDHLVLVIQGAIGADNEAVIAKYKDDPRVRALDIVRLPDGNIDEAMNIGLASCKGAWMMLVNSTGRSRPDRVQVHLDYVKSHPNIDIFSSWCEEVSEKGQRLNIRPSAIQHDDVVKALRWRNVIVTGANLIRASALREIGGYRARSGKTADYNLYVRLALAGGRFRVIPAALISVPAYRCPREWSDVIDQIRHRFFCLKSGFISFPQFLVATGACTIFGAIETGLYQVRTLFDRGRGVRRLSTKAVQRVKFRDITDNCNMSSGWGSGRFSFQTRTAETPSHSAGVLANSAEARCTGHHTATVDAKVGMTEPPQAA